MERSHRVEVEEFRREEFGGIGVGYGKQRNTGNSKSWKCWSSENGMGEMENLKVWVSGKVKCN